MAVAVALIAGAFVMDVMTPRGVADWPAYLIVPAVSSWWLSRRQTITLVAADSLLMIVGYYFSAPGIDPAIALFNRSIAVLVLWTAGFILIRHRRTQRLLLEREQELEAANQELEAFSYSVSHDLRKPLTIINGYCQVMLDTTLDEQNREYLREIHAASLRMNDLIEALLEFSRMSHDELRREPVNLSELAGAIAAELRSTQPERRVDFVIGENIVVSGDSALLRIVMENLLGNAWKYTGYREDAVIEFGLTEERGKAACFVRDNGAGFDMAHAAKLFVPFQRLPCTEKFEGHGIGLATVLQIVLRHGGKVWAEGEPGKGATFFFTLS